MFEDILGPTRPELPPSEEFMGCPFCGKKNYEEDGPGTFPDLQSYHQPMVCLTCGGKWTIEYNEDLEVEGVSL